MSHRPPSHPPGYKNMLRRELKANEYEARVECKNCGEIEILPIPMGVEVIRGANKIPCKNCGCKDWNKYR